ncbi:hypothetical protein C8R43DRAFT_515796 [Mycena crocata]|nr:hypothetical protein C8R43DRAFT_515796 [Mycena crocata]
MLFTGNASVLACASVLLALAAQTSAHAIPSPALGVKGTPKRGDVQRPSNQKPCGNINPANTIDSSTAVPVAGDGSVTINVLNFNAGGDGSTSVSVQVDATGTGNKFVAGTVKTNGNPKPNKVESDKVVFSLPAGTKCTGGKSKNLCLVSVKTTAGFGACTVVSQGKAAAAAPPAAAPKPAAPKPAAPKPAPNNNQQANNDNQAAKAKDNKDATKKAAAAKNASAASKKKHHHNHNKGKGMNKDKQNKANQGMNKGNQNMNKKQGAQGQGKKTREENSFREIMEELEAEMQRRDYELELERRTFQ